MSLLGEEGPIVSSPPQICLGCAHWTGAECRLLATPTPANRAAILDGQPCDVATRLREYDWHVPPSESADLAQAALARWLDPELDVTSLGRHGYPRDARLWATRWPRWHLLNAELKRISRARARRAAEGEPAGAHARGVDEAIAIEQALDELSELDGRDVEIVADLLAEVEKPSDPRGPSAATISNQKWLASYRFLMLYHGVLDHLEDRPAADALRVRRFDPAVASSNEAKESYRRLHPGLDWKLQYLRGVKRSLEILVNAISVDAVAKQKHWNTWARLLVHDVDELRHLGFDELPAPPPDPIDLPALLGRRT